tara:strand:+ start:201 stop:308 length:108 start_codon:yes stop_codon:yes gene_type:complete
MFAIFVAYFKTQPLLFDDREKQINTQNDESDEVGA